MDNKQKSPVWLTPAQVAARLHMEPVSLQGWRQKEIGPPWVKVGGKTGAVYYPEDLFEEWQRSQPLFIPAGSKARVSA